MDDYAQYTIEDCRHNEALVIVYEIGSKDGTVFKETALHNVTFEEAQKRFPTATNLSRFSCPTCNRPSASTTQDQLNKTNELLVEAVKLLRKYQKITEKQRLTMQPYACHDSTAIDTDTFLDKFGN